VLAANGVPLPDRIRRLQFIGRKTTRRRLEATFAASLAFLMVTCCPMLPRFSITRVSARVVMEHDLQFRADRAKRFSLEIDPPAAEPRLEHSSRPSGG
jgi:hypothetical protein